MSNGSSVRLWVRIGGQADGTRMVGEPDGFGEVCLVGLITVRLTVMGLSVDVLARVETSDEDDNGGLQDEVGGQ